MDNKNILIVDDSPFQIAILKEMLTQHGFNVVGEAQSLEEVKSETARLKPDLVTMDMTIPGTDGFECTEEIHKIDENIKVIIISAMMDDELVNKAKKLNVSGYIQKPVDDEELALLINRVLGDDTAFAELQDLYEDAFKESVINLFNKLTKTIPIVKDNNDDTLVIKCEGIAVVMGITGKYSGRMILNMPFETAENLAKVLLRRDANDKTEVLNVTSELSNMIAGSACSLINKKNSVYGLRVAPPTTINGESINISKTELENTYTADITTKYGILSMNIGFKRGASKWTSII